MVGARVATHVREQREVQALVDRTNLYRRTGLYVPEMVRVHFDISHFLQRLCCHENKPVVIFAGFFQIRAESASDIDGSC